MLFSAPVCGGCRLIRSIPVYLTRKRRFITSSSLRTPISSRCWDKALDSITRGKRQYSSYTPPEFELNNEILNSYLKALSKEYQAMKENVKPINVQSTSQQKSLNRRSEELSRIVSKFEVLESKKNELEDMENMLAELKGDEREEMKALATQEKDEQYSEIKELESQLLEALMPADELESASDIIVEMSAGAGGQEAMLFTAEILSMYHNYASYKCWNFDLYSCGHGDAGGIRSVTFGMSGHQVYKFMKHEGGVHRVKRVPKTERKGRIHTSTASVAVLPRPKEINIDLDPKDLKIETKLGSGPGGQSVQKTESAVRIVHIPTGIAAECQEERSQQVNRERALKSLQARIYQREFESQHSRMKSQRLQQILGRDRSDKIRSYTFYSNMVVDHRTKESFHGVESFMLGGRQLDQLLQSLEKDCCRQVLMAKAVEYLKDSSKL